MAPRTRSGACRLVEWCRARSPRTAVRRPSCNLSCKLEWSCVDPRGAVWSGVYDAPIYVKQVVVLFFLRHESPLLFSMQTPMLWLPGMVLLGCCHGWKRLGRGSALLKKSWGRIEWLAKAKWARYECRSSRTRAECLKKSVLKCITPLNVSYRSRTRLCARASRERIRLDSRSVQVLMFRTDIYMIISHQNM